MYAPFFGLEHPPFSIAPDPRYLFMSERHREALAHLLYGLDAGGGFVLLTGEVGTGKTTVCRCFLEQIPAHCDVAYIFNPKLTVTELLRSICDEFGVAHTAATEGGETVKDCIDPLNEALLQAHAAGRACVLIIDEAQNLSADVLEQLRLLTNLETRERKLLQIILIGQPELRDMVAQPHMEQLAQRVIARFHLDALSTQETRQYIAHRLTVAGLSGPVPFHAKALQRVHALTGGVPRRINLLCDRAMLGAYAAGTREVSVPLVDGAAREVFDDARVRRREGTRSYRPGWVPLGGAALAGAAVAVAVGWAVGGGFSLQAGGMHQAGVPAASAVRGMADAAVVRAPTAQALPAAWPAFLAEQPTGDAAAWARLVSAWGAEVSGGGAACASPLPDGLRCYRNRRASVPLLRQLDRPALLWLKGEGERGAGVAVFLSQLVGETATLQGVGPAGQSGSAAIKVPLAALAAIWEGDMATVWRTPLASHESRGVDDTAEGRAWLDAALDRAAGRTAVPPGQRSAAQRKAQVQQFQRSQGLAPDGLAGPLTQMLLNRAAGVNEPRLRTGD